MAAFVKSINASIRANKVADYICSTHFWGPVSTFGIPIAAMSDIQRAPADKISLPMTCALAGYSAVFMRFAFAVTPKNYLLFVTHVVNEAAQLTQGYRYFQHHYGGVKERPAAQEVKDDAAVL